MEISKISSKGQVVIPQRLRKKYGIKSGTQVGFLDKDGAIILKPLTKEYFEGLAGWLKGDAIGELMREKKRESEF